MSDIGTTDRSEVEFRLYQSLKELLYEARIVIGGNTDLNKACIRAYNTIKRYERERG